MTGWPWWRGSLLGLVALALALSSYLGWHSMAGGSVMGCGGGSPCDLVLHSRWSLVAGGLPVSGLAAGAYMAMLVAVLFIGPGTVAPVRRLAWRALLVLVGAVAGGAVWFIIVQKWVIGAFCPYCIAAHITGLLLAALALWRAPRQAYDDLGGIPPSPTNPLAAKPVSAAVPVPAVGPAARRRGIGVWPALGPVLAGVAVAGLMAASQVVFPQSAGYRGGRSQPDWPALDPRAVPLIGSPDARFVVALLFDYKCPHCQQLHFLLEEAVRLGGGRLAFALCPTPLSTQCNPYIPREVEEFKDSCELAKVALAVWVAKRGAFPAFDRWMFSFESGDRWQPRSLAAATDHAIALVGRAEFEAARTDPGIDRHLQTSLRIFGGTARSGNTAVPKLVFGSRWVVPEPKDAADLVSILQDSLAFPSR